MSKKMMIAFSVWMIVLMTGCASHKPIKTPCSHSGWPCGQKLKINQDI